MNGSCVGNVQLSGPVNQSEGVFLHRFQRTSFASQQVLGNSGLTSGDRIVVSDQEGRLVGLATGYMCEVSRTSICCTLDRWEQVCIYLPPELCQLEDSELFGADITNPCLMCFPETCQSSAAYCFDWTVMKVLWASVLTSLISPDWWKTPRTGSYNTMTLSYSTQKWTRLQLKQ